MSQTLNKEKNVWNVPIFIFYLMFVTSILNRFVRIVHLKTARKFRRGKTALAILYDHDKCTKQTSARLLILPRKIRFRLRYDMFIQGKILPQYDQDNQVFWLMILSYYKNENLAMKSKKGFFYRKGEVKMSTYRLREAYTPVWYGDHALLVPVEKLCNTP